MKNSDFFFPLKKFAIQWRDHQIIYNPKNVSQLCDLFSKDWTCVSNKLMLWSKIKKKNRIPSKTRKHQKLLKWQVARWASRSIGDATFLAYISMLHMLWHPNNQKNKLLLYHPLSKWTLDLIKRHMLNLDQQSVHITNWELHLPWHSNKYLMCSQHKLN